MEVSFVRQQLLATVERARRGAQARRQRSADAQASFETFLNTVAIPVVRMLAVALKAERLAFTASTPGGSVRLSSDNGRDDFLDIILDMSVDPPEVVGRVSRSRGSRTLTDERPLKAGAAPDAIREEDVLAFLLTALEPLLER